MKTTLVVLLLALPFSLAASDVAAPAVAIEQEASQFLIPVAGSVIGARGEHFRTNLTIVNFRNAEQLVEVTFLPQTGAPVSKRFAIPYLTNLTWADIVGEHLGASGLGALVVTAIDASGRFDAVGRLDGNARIWTAMADGRGELSSFVSGVALREWRQDSPAYVHGVRHTSQFRTSYGIVNLDIANSRRFRVIVNSGLGKWEEIVEVRPFAMVQRPVAGNVYGDLSIYVEPLGSGGPWRAYGTSTDNESRSSWIVPAMQPRSDIVFP